jgi:serine/threonine-protein kinase
MSENELQHRAEKRIGSVLCGKYRIDSVLGVGGMAVVYAATHRNQKRVAIKMLHPELAMHDELRARFLREGYAANTVDHPGAVAVLDDDAAEDGAAFLVMERLEGEEVDRLWQQRGQRLGVDAVLSIASQLLDVLAVAHAKSIIHRDIKPANLYLTTDGTLKVLDFGIARVRDAATTGQAATSTGMMLGTPAYMAPEQALGKSREIDGTTDNWSVGATMFALLSGRLVHEGETVTELIVKLATQPAPSLAAVAPHVDPRVVEIVDRALGFEKAGRWPSALAMRDAVRAAYLAIFGAKISKEPLERLMAERAAWTGATLPVDAVMTVPPALRASPTTSPTGAARVATTQEMTAWPTAQGAQGAAARPPSAIVGASTARPVQAEASAPPRGGPRPIVVGLVVGLGAMATLLAVVGVGRLVLARRSADAANVASAAPVEPATAVVSASPPPAPPPAVVLEAAAPPAETTPVEAAPGERGAPSPPAARPAPARTPAPRPAAPRSPTQPNCDPPYSINLSGQRVRKLECP